MISQTHRSFYHTTAGRADHKDVTKKQEEPGRSAPEDPGKVLGPSHPPNVKFAVARGAATIFASGTVAGGGSTGIVSNMSQIELPERMYHESDRSGVGRPPHTPGGPPEIAVGRGEIKRVVTRSPPICVLSRNREEERGDKTSQYRENKQFGGDRVTTPTVRPSQYGGLQWSPRRVGGRPTPDHLTEVTL